MEEDVLDGTMLLVPGATTQHLNVPRTPGAEGVQVCFTGFYVWHVIF